MSFLLEQVFNITGNNPVDPRNPLNREGDDVIEEPGIIIGVDGTPPVTPQRGGSAPVVVGGGGGLVPAVLTNIAVAANCDVNAGAGTSTLSLNGTAFVL